MSIIGLLVFLVVVGVVLYVFNTLVPMDARMKMVCNAIIGLLIFLYVLQALGIWNSGLRL